MLMNLGKQVMEICHLQATGSKPVPPYKAFGFGISIILHASCIVGYATSSRPFFSGCYPQVKLPSKVTLISNTPQNPYSVNHVPVPPKPPRCRLLDQGQGLESEYVIACQIPIAFQCCSNSCSIQRAAQISRQQPTQKQERSLSSGELCTDAERQCGCCDNVKIVRMWDMYLHLLFL